MLLLGDPLDSAISGMSVEIMVGLDPLKTKTESYVKSNPICCLRAC